MKLNSQRVYRGPRLDVRGLNVGGDVCDVVGQETLGVGVIFRSFIEDFVLYSTVIYFK